MPLSPKARGLTARAVAWAPPEFDYDVAMAVFALNKGEATPPQQALALQWIITGAAQTYETSFRPDKDGGALATAFAEGRRFVGLQIVGLVNLPGEAFEALRSKANG